ncbi:HAMP domain-containing histidine kinase [Alkaliphilus pronyensis]|uniref:histidine kinase n=1 Tax=Alkaliphilus pronyensis TaxID=1482732 RepID=A0A6I0F282_9FIRM|nr:HAMP domain-containing sensor histidine kinase [Alkaliphilus pronyensis]KAB3531301.1 HAMP domain-containing histidine kinase [Alkaliphilus pronyensis]
MDTNSNNKVNKKEDLNEETYYKNNDKETLIKETTKSKRTPFSLIMILIIVVISVSAVASFPPLKDYMFSPYNNTAEYLESYDFLRTLTRITSYNQSKINGNGWHDSRFEDIESINYFIKSYDKDITITNIDNSIGEEEAKDSLFYLHIMFDEEGNVSKLEAPNRFDKDVFINRLQYNDEIKKKYANMQILYFVPIDFKNYNDMVTQNMKYYFANPDYLLLIIAIGAIASILLTIITFIMPYSLQSELSISRLFNKLFLEFKIIIWLIALACSAGSIILIDNSSKIFTMVDIIYDANEYFYIIGIPITIIIFVLLYLSIAYTKYIYHKGIKKGLIENSITGRISLHVLRYLKKIVKSLMEIDLNKDVYRKLVLILGVNLLALWMIASTQFFGYILSIAYTIFLFQYLSKLINNVKAINIASLQLSEGSFDIKLEENIGVLSPIAKNLNNIREGFQLAVDKEIKSQKMKTELISNVSHDLKTPLTSIITYIDLLKNEDLSLNKQKEYIEVLDKKSNRLKYLIEDLFEASKANSGNIELNLEEVDIIALFRQTLGEMEEKINSSGLQFKVDTLPEKTICYLDGKRTYRIFENIMSNIIKYSMVNTRVYINIEENEKEVSFIFKNISNYEMNFDPTEITERFTRGDKSRNTEGSGLGLSIAKSFIELQNGKMEINIDGDLFKLTATFPKI